MFRGLGTVWLLGKHSNLHRHTYETVLYVLEGEGFSFIQGRKIPWKKDDALYIPVWAWHNHHNTSTTEIARYLACENAPMLQNMGGVALREEVGDKPASEKIENYEIIGGQHRTRIKKSRLRESSLTQLLHSKIMDKKSMLKN